MFAAVHDQLSAVTSVGKARVELETVIGELARVEAHATERRLMRLRPLVRLRPTSSLMTPRNSPLTGSPGKRSRGPIVASTRTGRRPERFVNERPAKPGCGSTPTAWCVSTLSSTRSKVKGCARRSKAEVDRLWRADGGRSGTPDQIRTPDQRGADALTDLLTAVDAASGAGSAKRPHPKYQVHVRVDADRLRHNDPHVVAEFVDGTPLSQTLLERLACDSAFVGAVFDTSGAVLWQDRSQRIATDDQWAALISRDAGCVICNADPAHCQAHHLDPWAPPTNGNTDIDRLALVCTQDHHLIHDYNYTLTTGKWRLKPPKTSAAASRKPVHEAA